GQLQAVFARKEVPEAVWEAFGTLTQETSVAVSGLVREDARAPGGYELTASALEILGPSPDFPITPKEHGTQFLFEHRHLWLRSRRQVAIAKVRHAVIQGMHDFFDQRGFTHVDTPILTGSIGEEAGELFAVDYFDLGKAYLAQTGQLYVEAAAAALGKVYCFGPTFRAEKSKTRRHLTEFWMVEPEVAFNDSDANMRLQEEFVSFLVARALERCGEQLKELERDTTRLERITPPFPRISYSEAIPKLNQLGSDITWGQDLGADDETRLSQESEKPVFVCNYPSGVKAFYMKENPADPRTVLNNDCLAPEGYGEIIGGSQREDDHDRLLARLEAHGLDASRYAWYLDLRKYGTFIHSGFGMGVERTVAWICGIQHIREAIAFPRQIHRLYP
ncbi:MAG TPA: asparagine--tRNA ligase, partial [Gemmatimonadales bacterium]|nr:asparagine--tRNA ligase [Gemmatimonadales bacterium]